jgi:hypothetical protein
LARSARIAITDHEFRFGGHAETGKDFAALKRLCLPDPWGRHAVSRPTSTILSHTQLSNRFDYVFERGFSSIDGALLVGDAVFENVRPLRPSDHAGAIASVDIPEPSAGTLLVSAVFLLVFLKLRHR